MGRTQSGQRLSEAAPRVDCESLTALLAALTPRRLELLDVLGSNPGASIRALAGRLRRDYKNVHGDGVSGSWARCALRQAQSLPRTPSGDMLCLRLLCGSFLKHPNTGGDLLLQIPRSYSHVVLGLQVNPEARLH